MPLYFEEVVAEVEPERAARAARAEAPAPAPGERPEPDPRCLRREIHRMARRAARLHAD